MTISTCTTGYIGVLIEKVWNMPKRPEQTDDDDGEQKTALWLQMMLGKPAPADLLTDAEGQNPHHQRRRDSDVAKIIDLTE